jgi:hypothetical protein
VTLNLVNNQTLISWDMAVTGDAKGPFDEYGLPLNYVKGPNFGNAKSTTDYPRPRQGMDGGRTFLASFGLRF